MNLSTHMAEYPAPRLDLELAAGLAIQLAHDPSPITLDDVPVKRLEEQIATEAAVKQLADRGIICQEVWAQSADGVEVPISILHSAARTATSPFIYYIHGGGMMMGNRWSGLDVMLEWIERYNAVVATVEYRLAPEHPFPAPHEDCYAGLEWLAAHAEGLGLRIESGLIAGISAGAGLAAAVSLMARDRSGPRVAGQLLLAPMLDDRGTTISTLQYPTGMWNSAENSLGWRSLLGVEAERVHTLPAHAVPGRCDDLSDLPHTYLEVGSAEVFRDETVSFASRIWAAGGQADLHVWAGGFHGFQAFEHTLVAQGAAHARSSWMDRVLGVPGIASQQVAAPRSPVLGQDSVAEVRAG